MEHQNDTRQSVCAQREGASQLETTIHANKVWKMCMYILRHPLETKLEMDLLNYLVSIKMEIIHWVRMIEIMHFSPILPNYIYFVSAHNKQKGINKRRPFSYNDQ